MICDSTIVAKMGMKLAFFLDIWNIFDAITATWTAVTQTSGGTWLVSNNIIHMEMEYLIMEPMIHSLRLWEFVDGFGDDFGDNKNDN